VAEQDLLGHIAVIRARMALADQDLSSAVELAHQALEYVPASHPVRGHIAVIQGQAAFMRGDLAGAGQALGEAVSIAQDCGHLFMVVDATTRLGYLQTLQGHLSQALQTYGEALQLAEVQGRKLPVAGNAHIRMALALRQRNELDAAGHHLMQGLELCKLLGNPRSGYLALAHLRQAQGDWDGALRAVQDAERESSGFGAAFDLRDYGWLWCKAALWQDPLSLARDRQQRLWRRRHDGSRKAACALTTNRLSTASLSRSCWRGRSSL
jgi:LuxR family maltose regulon positive regulatory protein